MFHAIEFVTPLPGDFGKVVGMCEFQGRLLIAMENGVFRLDPDGSLHRINFDGKPPDKVLVPGAP